MCSFCITFLLLAYKNRHTDQSSQLGLISELPVSAEFDHLLGRGIALAAAGAVFLVSLGSAAFMGTEFVPAEDRGEFQVIVDLPPGTSFDESVSAVAKIEQDIKAIPEVRQIFSTVGVNGQVRSSNIRVRTTKKNERTRRLADIKNEVRAKLATMPFVDGKVADPEFMQGAPYEPPINVFVRGDDLAAERFDQREDQIRYPLIPVVVPEADEDLQRDLPCGARFPA